MESAGDTAAKMQKIGEKAVGTEAHENGLDDDDDDDSLHSTCVLHFDMAKTILST